MKRQILIGTALFVVMSAFSQTGSKKPKPSGMMNGKLIAEAKYGMKESATPFASNSSKGSNNSKRASKTSAINTWQSFTSSMNIYGSSGSNGKPLQWNDELNSVTFIHRKSPSYATTNTTPDTENGSIVAMISGNFGTTWDSTLLYAEPVHRGRYPQGAIFNPPGNTIIDNAHIVVNGPITHGDGWVGNYYASKKMGTINYNSSLSTDVGAQQNFLTASWPAGALPKHDFSAYSFSAPDNGKLWCLATVATDINNVTTPGDSGVMIISGTYNSTNSTFDWSGVALDPPTRKDQDGERQHAARPIMAWNEAGTVGYVVIIGARKLSTGSNVGMQPIVYKSIDAGGNWTLENGIDFDLPVYNDVKRSITGVSADPDFEIPYFNWIEGMDCIVDKDNKLHIFSTIIGSISNHSDSATWFTTFGNEGYRWPHTPGARPYLYDFIYDGTASPPIWSHITVDSMSSEGPSGVSAGKGYLYNPWDTDPTNDNQKVRIDARPQMSRTPDGKYIVYTWTESDTGYTDDQVKWNQLPDIKARVLDVQTGLINPIEIDVTSPTGGDIGGHAMFDFVSPKCKLVTEVTNGAINGPTILVPMTVSNSLPYRQRDPNTHWYSAVTLQFNDLGVGIAENALNSVNSSVVYPNPAKDNVTVNINLVTTSKVNIEVLNTIGQVVKTVNTQGHIGSNHVNVELNNLASGIYFMNIKVDNAQSTKKIIVE